jgi:hypothetical protein
VIHNVLALHRAVQRGYVMEVAGHDVHSKCREWLRLPRGPGQRRYLVASLPECLGQVTPHKPGGARYQRPHIARS